MHPLVSQLRFTRSEFMRGLAGLSAEDAIRRLEPMNCISWMIGHLASQEQWYWVILAQEKRVAPDLHRLVGTGRPATTPPLEDMLDVWERVTQAADRYLDTITASTLETHLLWRGEPVGESVGTSLLRNAYHYWFHLGEVLAVRQMLGHTDLPEFVGDMSTVNFV